MAQINARVPDEVAAGLDRWARAEGERQAAKASTLPNLRNQALRSAERWDEMAARVELAQAQAVVNRAGK